MANYVPGPGLDTEATYKMYTPQWPKIRQRLVSLQKTAEAQMDAARKFDLTISAMKHEISGPGAFFARFTVEQKCWYMDSSMYTLCFPDLKYPIPCPPNRLQILSQPKPHSKIVAAPRGVVLDESGIPTPEFTQSPTGTQQQTHLLRPQNSSSMPYNEEAYSEAKVNQTGVNKGQSVADGWNMGIQPAQEQPQSFATGRRNTAAYNDFIQSRTNLLQSQTDPTDMTVALSFQPSGDPRQMRQGGLQQMQRGKLEQTQRQRLISGSPQSTGNNLQQIPGSRPISASPQLTTGYMQQIQRPRSISSSSRSSGINLQQTICNRSISASPQQAASSLQYSHLNASMSPSFPNGNFEQTQRRRPMPASPQLPPLNLETMQHIGDQQNHFTNYGFQQIQQLLQTPVSPRLVTNNQDFIQHNDILVESCPNDGFQKIQQNDRASISLQFLPKNIQQPQQAHPLSTLQRAGTEPIQRNHLKCIPPQLFANEPQKMQRMRSMSTSSQLSGSGFQQMHASHRASASPHLPPGFIQNLQPKHRINPPPRVPASTLKHMPNQGNGSPAMEYYIPSPPERLQQSTNNKMISPTRLPRASQLQHSHSRVSSDVSGKRNWDSFQEGEESVDERFLRPGFPSIQ